MGSPREWPGAHAVDALLTGDPLEGVWRDRTQEYRYRLRGKEPAPGQFATRETLTLDPLPCWKDLPPEEYRRRIAELVAEIEEEARVAWQAKGVEPLGADAVRRQQPHTRPNRTKKSPAPLFHTASKKAYLSESAGGVQPVRGCLSGRRREAEGRRPGGSVPGGELPSGSAVRTAGLPVAEG